GDVMALFSFPTRRSSDLGVGQMDKRVSRDLPDMAERDDLRAVENKRAEERGRAKRGEQTGRDHEQSVEPDEKRRDVHRVPAHPRDRKSTRLNSSHLGTSY